MAVVTSFILTLLNSVISLICCTINAIDNKTNESFRYLKSTIGNITLIQRFRKRHEDKEETPEEAIFNFWMDFFMDATKADPSDQIRFPVSF